MLPNFHQISVNKAHITNYKVFKELISLYNLKIAYEEPMYYILDGDEQDLHDFQRYWRDI